MHVDTGNTAWVLVCAALVLLMTPGLAFFYGGMVRAKNVLAMLMQSWIAMGVVSVLWVLAAYSLAFGAGNGFIGDLHQWGLSHIQAPVAGGLAPSVPPLAFVAFQLMFAVITPALITGATADRLRFGAWTLFCGGWVLVVYAPIAHWVWAPSGWLSRLGAEDFAGGTVVHANAGAAGLALALVLGRRTGWPREQMRPHNVPLVVLGAGLLWFGWFGFNAGSALGANTSAAYAFVNTNTATAAAVLGWLVVERLRDGRPSTLGAASGAVAGLVAITPACGFVSPLGSIAVGLLAGAVCAGAVGLKYRLRYDDALDVVGVHLVGGVLGALLVGVLGTARVGGRNGLLYGGGLGLLGRQAVAVAATVGYSFVVSLALAFAVRAVARGGLRVSAEQEHVGLDYSLHAESAYSLLTVVGGALRAHGRQLAGEDSDRRPDGKLPADRVGAEQPA